MEPRIAVIGAGAIGGVTAAFARMAGYDVELVTRYPDVARKIENEGILITGVKGTHRVKIKSVPRISDLSGIKDIVFHATKATNMVKAAEDVLPFLKEDSLLVSMQNGICEYRLGEIVGMDRVLGCVVGWGATMVEPGHIEMTSTGYFWIGYVNRPPDDRLKEVKRILENIVPVEVPDDIIPVLFSKLIINSSITSMGAITGMYLGDMLANRKIRKIFIKIMEEALEVANAMGIKVPPYGGKLDYYKLVTKRGISGEIYRYIVLRSVGFKYRRLKSSSLQSLERGKPTEIDYLNGFIVQKGKEYGIDTPVNRKIVDLVKEIERGERSISPENIKEIPV